MLNFIYYPVSFVLWVWHKAFGYLFGEASGITWALAVVFLVFTLRAILYKPFVYQVRSMRKMQEFQPEIAKLRKKYANDKQKQTEEMQRLQKEHGVNPLGGCLPVLVQVPVFIGLFHVLREFKPGKTGELLLRRRRQRLVHRRQLLRGQAGCLGDVGPGRAGPAGHLDDPDAHRDDPADDRCGHLHAHHRAALGGPADLGAGRQPADRDHEQADAVRVPDRGRGRGPVPAAGRAAVLGGEQPLDARPAVRGVPEDRLRGERQEGRRGGHPAGARPATRAEARPAGDRRARRRRGRHAGARRPRPRARSRSPASPGRPVADPPGRPRRPRARRTRPGARTGPPRT